MAPPASSSSDVSSVRIVARIRPLLPHENNCDIVVTSDGNSVKMPNPKNDKEEFTFPFNAVYPMESDQAQIFSEVSPTLKHLFKGNDVTLFAHGVTGSGKTYTMKGNNKPADRGIIPRLLTAIYRRGKDMEKRTEGETTMSAVMSYYEIYNDRVFDLFQPPEKRTLAGLPLREANGKTHVIGLSEMEITTLKEFETLYDSANKNRSTSSTKLNAHSSRSHAVMCVRVTITNNTTREVKTGTVSCIDLAGSEDNRRTANDKERMVESASINKSLFVLAQCVEAMTKKQSRIPYRESKMTRILSLGQNNGMTVMILNLAPTRQYHQDTLQALNFANRAKKIEVKNTENQSTFLPPPPAPTGLQPSIKVHGAPVRAFGTVKNSTTHNTTVSTSVKDGKKPVPVKSSLSRPDRSSLTSKPLKPIAKSAVTKPSAVSKPAPSRNSHHYRHNPSKENQIDIENLVEKKVEQILAARALNEKAAAVPPPSDADTKNDEIQKRLEQRLEQLERKLEKKADAGTEGLMYITLGRQHAARGETVSALKMYQLAQKFFPDNGKLKKKISDLQAKRQSEPPAFNLDMSAGNTTSNSSGAGGLGDSGSLLKKKPVKAKRTFAVFTDVEGEQFDERLKGTAADDGTHSPVRKRAVSAGSLEQSPRTRQLLRIINSEDVEQIMKLKGVGKKRAEALAMHVRSLRQNHMDDDDDDDWPAIKDLHDLGLIKGIGNGMVESMRSGIQA